MIFSSLAQRVARLLILLLGVNALLFVALGLAGDPALMLAGEDPTPELIERIRAEYGLDLPAWQRYLVQLGRMAQLDFGVSLYTGQTALFMVLEQLPATLLMAVLSMALTLITAIPAGAWIGLRPEAASRRFGAALTAVAQGIPGFVMALVLIQVFVVRLGWLPSLGYAQPAAWILPSISLGFFLAPKLCRVVSAGVAEAMQEDYIRTARANGASMQFILWREALPAALPAAVALVGTQFAFLVSGVVLIETLFLWPGIGLLLLRSAQAPWISRYFRRSALSSRYWSLRSTVWRTPCCAFSIQGSGQQPKENGIRTTTAGSRLRHRSPHHGGKRAAYPGAPLAAGTAPGAGGGLHLSLRRHAGRGKRPLLPGAARAAGRSHLGRAAAGIARLSHRRALADDRARR